MQLSPHFTLEEFTRSETARALQPPDDNQPTAADLVRLQDTAQRMEQVREVCGSRRILISSAYRNRRVNEAVGGVSDSAHARGLACDFQVMGLPLLKASALIVASPIRFDQLIHETGRGILHISFDQSFRRELLTQPDGPGTPFLKGIT